jgi:hypothetical protein
MTTTLTGGNTLLRKNLKQATDMSLIATFDVGETTSKKQKHITTTTTTASPLPRHLRCSIYLGGKEDAKSLEKLKQRRISHILNVTPPKQIHSGMGVPNYFEKQQQQHKFTYLRVPLFDDATSVMELQKDSLQNTIVDFIHRGLYHGNVLVHCHHGVSRSTTCVALYLMR